MVAINNVQKSQCHETLNWSPTTGCCPENVTLLNTIWKITTSDIKDSFDPSHMSILIEYKTKETATFSMECNTTICLLIDGQIIETYCGNMTFTDSEPWFLIRRFCSWDILKLGKNDVTISVWMDLMKVEGPPKERLELKTCEEAGASTSGAFEAEKESSESENSSESSSFMHDSEEEEDVDKDALVVRSKCDQVFVIDKNFFALQSLEFEARLKRNNFLKDVVFNVEAKIVQLVFEVLVSTDQYPIIRNINDGNHVPNIADCLEIGSFWRIPKLMAAGERSLHKCAHYCSFKLLSIADRYDLKALTQLYISKMKIGEFRILRDLFASNHLNSDTERVIMQHGERLESQINN